MAGTGFHVDTRELEKMAKLFKMAPKELQKPVSRYLGDMAYDYKNSAIEVLEGTYTIRDMNFVKNRAFTVQRPKASAPIGEQEAVAASLRIDGAGGLFTGWEEEITGKPRELRKKSGAYHRGIGGNAREGGSIYEKVMGKYRLRAGGMGYNSDKIPDSREYPDLSFKQFLAMLYKSMGGAKVVGYDTETYYKEKVTYNKDGDEFITSVKRTRKKKIFGKPPKPLLGKNKVFIMSGPAAPLGLYAFDSGVIRRMQTFHEQPVRSEVGKFDWQSEAIEMTDKKFTASYVWEKYIAPMINALFEKK